MKINKFLGDDEVQDYIKESLPDIETIFANFKERVRQMDEIYTDIIQSGDSHYIQLANQVLKSYGYTETDTHI